MIPLRDTISTRTVPFVTRLLVIVNVAVFLLELLQGEDLDAFVQTFAFVSDRFFRPELYGWTFGAAAFTILTSMFLHGGFLHLLGNMLFLWIFGNNVEDHLGSVGYLLFYLAAGVVATLAFTAVNASSVSPLLGASGAIAGVMGAYLIWFPRARILSVVFPLFFLPFYLPAALVLAVWFVTQFFTDPNSGVAWVAHVSGFAFGALVAMSLRDTRGPHSRRVPPPPPLPGQWPGGLRGFE